MVNWEALGTVLTACLAILMAMGVVGVVFGVAIGFTRFCEWMERRQVKKGFRGLNK